MNKIYLLTIVLIVLLIPLEGYPKEKKYTRQFYFTLIDSSNNFYSRDDFQSIKFTKRKKFHEFKFQKAKYVISGENIINIWSGEGLFSLKYTTNEESCSLKFKIERTLNKKTEEFFLDFKTLLVDPFIELKWEANTISKDFSFGKNWKHYYYITPFWDKRGRDLTCYTYGTCKPVWLLSEEGKKFQAKQIKLKIEKTKNQLDHQADSLINHLFFPNTFERYFELKCENGYYNRYYPPNCAIRQDSTFYAISRTYQFKDKGIDTFFTLELLSTLQNNKAYFSNQSVNQQKISSQDLEFISKEKMIEIAKNNFPDFDFALDQNGNPKIFLNYLASRPKDKMPFQEEMPISKVNGDYIEKWQPSFVYVMHSKQKDEHEIICSKFLYFSATNARFLARTLSCYSLIDE